MKNSMHKVLSALKQSNLNKESIENLSDVDCDKLLSYLKSHKYISEKCDKYGEPQDEYEITADGLYFLDEL